jgi:hypothetical protein
VPGAYLAALMAELAGAVVDGAELAALERCTFRRRVRPGAPIKLTARRLDATRVDAQVEAAGTIAAAARLVYRRPA